MRLARRAAWAVVVSLLAAAASGDEVARANLSIAGASLQIEKGPVATGIDVPASVQTTYAGAASADLSVRGELSGPGLDAPIALATMPGGRFQIPALHQAGDYTLSNVRLVDRDGKFIQQSVPSAITITVAEVLKTDVRVRQLTPDELRQRGINVDGRFFDVYEMTFIFGIKDGETVEVPYPVIIDKRTHEVISAPLPSDQHLPAPPIAGPPPRFQPPYVMAGFVTEDIDASAPSAGVAAPGDSDVTRVRPVIPAAIVIPAGFGVLHQFFAVILNVTNNAPSGASIRLRDVNASLSSPLALRVAKIAPPVTIGQPVPIGDKSTGATFLVAQAEGTAEWSLEALQPGTHTLNIVVRATYSAPNQPDIPLKGTLQASVVVSDPRFHVNFVHPDNVRKNEPYVAYAFVTNASPASQTVVVDTHEITVCSTGLYANNICRIDGDPAPQITIAAGETKMLEYHLQSSINGHVFAGTGNAETSVTTSVTLAMGVSASGVPLSPATLVLPYYSKFLTPALVDAELGLLGIAYSLATAPLTARTALLPRVLTNDVMTRAQDLARAGQRVFINSAQERDAIFHLALDFLGNVERPEKLATTDDLRDFDALRRLDANGRKSAAVTARELERVGLTADNFAAVTAYRSPYALAVVRGAPIDMTVTGVTSKAQMAVVAEAAGGWKRDLAYGELTQFDGGVMAIVGRWNEPLELSITGAASFTVDVIYPDANDGSFLRASLPVTNADPQMPVKIVIDRGKQPVVTGAQIAGTLAATPVAQSPLQIAGAAQDLHLDDSGHIVSILLSRPIATVAREQFSLTTRVPAANYESTSTNVPGAALQDDGRIINVSCDHALSSNATYSMGINGILPAPTSIVPRIDNNAPGGIVFGRLLRGDGTPIANTLVQMLTSEHLQYDTTLAGGEFLFEFVPRDIERHLPGNYTLSAQADSKFASLDGVIRTPGEVQRVILQFLGRGSVTGTLTYSDGSAARGTITAGSTIYNEFHQVATDASGAFTINDLPVGPITVAAMDSVGNVTYGATQIHVAGEVITQNLTIQKRDFAGFATVRVTVIRSDTSASVAGAHVGVYTQGYGLMDGFTDADGRFEFVKVPAGFVSVLASEFNLTRESAGVDFDLRADSVVDQMLTLHVPVIGDAQFVTVHGTVWRDDPAAPDDRTRDQPVPNAVIMIRGLAQVVADTNGEYTYPSVPLALSGQKVITVFDPASGRKGSFALPTLQSGVTNELKLLLQSASPDGTATIRVHLVSAGGVSVSDYRVISPGFPEDVFTSKGNGVYELTVSVPRTVDVWAIPNGRNATYGDQVAHAGANADFDGQVVVKELRLPGQGTVLAKILIRKPCPIGQTTCAEEYDVGQGTLSVTYRVWDEAEQQLSQSTRTVSTDPTTSIATVAQIPVGEQPAIATLENPAGYASASTGPAFDGDTRQVELKLSQLGEATGRVMSFDGQTPVAGASVRLEGSSATLGPVFTGADGSFRFAGVAANQSFRIIAEATQNGVYRTGFVDAASPRTGGPVIGLVIVLHQQGSVDGVIVDATGATVPLAHYWARELAWPYRSFGSATDPLIAGNDGHFFLNNVFSGNVRVSAASPIHQEDRGDWQGQIGFENDSQTGVRLQIGSAGAGAVSVTVVDPNNGFALVPFAEVTLLRGDLGFDFATTDANGVAVFDSVPADFDYAVRASSKRVGRSGSSSVFHLVRDAIMPVQVVLDLTGRVSGTVVDGDVTPSPLVKGAPVLLSSAAVSATSSTASAGDFLFDGVPEGSFKLDAIDLDSGRHAFSSGDLFISKLFPERTGIQLSLEKTATLNIKTYLPDDLGQAGVLAPAVDVKVTQSRTPYSRELQGSDVTFAKLFARYSYHIQAKELGGEERVIDYDGDFATGSYSGNVALVFPTSGSVRVHVTADDPALIVSARVQIDGGNKHTTIFTDTNGTASAAGFPLGPVGIQVTSSSLSASVSGTLQSHATPLDVTVKLGSRASVDGYVDAEDGGPSSGSRVFIDVTSTALPGGTLRLDTRTDDSGHYAFAGIPVGGTHVKLTMFGADDITIGAVLEQSVPDGTTGTITLPRVKIDATQPRVVGIDPPNNANSVSPNANVLVAFSEPIAASYINGSYFQLTSTDDNRQANANVTTEIIDGAFAVRIAPASLLKSNVVYRVSISGAIEDLAGHTLIAPVGSSFTTVNYTEPRIIRVDPSIDLPLSDGATFRLKFNKPIDITSFQSGGIAKLEQLNGAHGQPIATIPVTLSLDDSDTATLVIAPTGVAIQPSAFYRITVSGTRDRQSPPNVQSIAQTFDFFSYDHVKPVVTIASPVPAGYPLISGIAYIARVAIVDEGTNAVSRDIQYVDWFEGDRFLLRTKLAPFSFHFASPAPGTYTLKASATDFSNNTSDLASFSWNVAPNNAPSDVKLTVTPSSFYLGGRGDAQVTFNDEGLVVALALKISGSYDLPVTNQQITRASVDAPWPAAQFSFVLPKDFAEGQPVHFLATVTDSINQSSSATQDVPLLTDSVPPQIISLTPASETHYKFGSTYRIALQAKDAESGVTHVVFAYDGQMVDVTSGSVDANGVATFSTNVTVAAKNTDTRIHIVATAYDAHGNSTPATADVIYDSVNDGTIPVAQWVTPLDGAALPASQTVTVKLRVHATDDVHVEAVQFDSNAFAAPVAAITTASAGAIYEQTATVNVPSSGSFSVTATVSDSDPSHNVVLPITIDAIPIDQQVVADAAITPSNAAQYANSSLLVSGPNTKLYVTVPITLRNLIVLGGAKVSNPDGVKVDVTATERVFVDGDSSIDLTAKGYLGGWARSEDGVTQNNNARGVSTGPGALDASGSYGGIGAGSSTNPAYGSVKQPSEFGSGGSGAPECCSAGANGGGAVALSADRIVIAGAIRADGGSGVGARDAGSGGSVLLGARTLITGPATRITANGGDDDEVASGDAGGGGGRIAATVTERFDVYDVSRQFQARGGRNGSGTEGATHLDAGAGTIFLQRPDESLGELIVSSFDERYAASTHQTRATPLSGTLNFDAITIGPRGLARFDSDYTAAAVNVDATALLLTPTDVPTVSVSSTAVSVIQDTAFAASYSATSRAGVGSVALTLIATAQSSFSDYPASIPITQATISVPFDAPPGTATLRATATDRAGRTAEAHTDLIIAANTPPVIDRIDVVPLQTYAGQSIAANVVAHDDVAVKSIGLVSTIGGVSQPSASSFSVFVPPDTPAGSVITLTASASDGFPSRAAVTQNATATILHDPNPPVITITSPIENASFDVSSLVTIPIHATVVDAEVGVTQVWASIDGGPAIAMVMDTTVQNGWKADVAVPSVDGSAPVTKSIVVFAKDYEPNTGQSAPRAIQVRPVFDPNGPTVTWLCPSAGALFPSGYTAKIRVSAAPASLDNGVTSVAFYVGDSTTAIPAISLGNNIYEASVALPAGAEGSLVPLKAVATSIRSNVAAVQRTVSLAAGTSIAGDTSIGANNMAFERGTLIVTAGTTTIDGHHDFARLIVLDGATVTHSIGGALDLSVTGTTYISCNGSIDASGRGQQGGTVGVGGSHGGQGSNGAYPFGSTFNPNEAGGAGDGPGGGVIHLQTAPLIVDGSVAANGRGTATAGAGGSVRVDSTTIGGSGIIAAKGGVGGGGGRMAVYFTTLTLPRANIDASGSAPGTIVLNRDLIVDNHGVASTGKSALTGVGIRTVSAATSTTVIDSTAVFPAPNVLAGINLIFGTTTSISWPIVANDTTTITVSPDASFVPQIGAQFRGLYRFDTLTLRNANLETMDLLQVSSAVDKDAPSTLVTGNLGPPVVTRSLISIIPTALGFAVAGRAGAATDPDTPVVITAKNVRTGETFSANAAIDGSFVVSISGAQNDAFTVTAKDSHRFPLQSGPVDAGTLSGATVVPTQVSSAGWSVDAGFIARTLALDGHILAVASYPIGTTGASDKLVVLDVSNPLSPVRLRSNSAAQGAIRDVALQNGWAFIAADRFATLNLSNPNATFVNTSESCGSRNAVAVSGGYAFVAEGACNQNGTIYVYDVTNPAAPRFLNSQAVAGISSHEFTDLQLYGNEYLIGISNSASGRDVMVIDRRDVNALRKVSELQIANFDAFRGVVSGTKLYLVSLSTPQAVVVSLQNPASPSVTGTLNLPAAAGGATVAEKDLLVADGGAGLIASSSDPAQLVANGAVATGGSAFDVAVYASTAFVANGTGLAIVPVGTAPVIDASRISIAPGATVTGIADAVRGQSPITVNVQNAAIVTTTIVSSDGSFSLSIGGKAGDALMLTATDSVGRVAGPVSIGIVPFGSSVATTSIVPPDATFRARTVVVDGTTVAVAGYPGASGNSDKLVVYDMSNPSAPVLRRSNQAAFGAIRDVVVQNGWAYFAADRFCTLNLTNANAAFVSISEGCGQRNAVVVSGGYAFAAETGCNQNGTIYVYDVTNPASPRFLSSQAVAGVSNHDFTDLQLYGSDYLVGISNSSSGRDVMVIDRRDVNALKKVGELQIASIVAFRGKVAGSLLYLAGGDGGAAIVDLSAPSAPRLVASVDTPGIARGVDVAGTTMAISDSGDGVSFFDVSDPANPRLIGVQATGGVAWDGAFGGKNLYVANDQGLAIIQNVAAPPRIDGSRISVTASSLTTALISGAPGAINGELPIRVDVANASTGGVISVTLASGSDGSFTVTLPASAGATVTLTATDNAARVSGPASIGAVPFGSAVTTTPIVPPDSTFRARTVAVDGATVAVAGYPGVSGNSDKLVVYDVSNPNAPVLRRSNQAAFGAIRDVIIQNGWAYLAADRFCTLNMSDPAATFVNTSESCGSRNAVVVAGGYAFVAEGACNQNGTIYVYDVTNPASPRFLGSQAVAGLTTHEFTDLQLFGSDYLIAISNAATGRDVMVIDRRDVNALRKVAELQIPSIAAFRGKVVGNLLYVAGGDGGVAIVDLSSPTSPRLVSAFDTPGIARGVDVAGTTLAVSDGGDGVSFYDISDPANPKFIGTQPTGGVAWDGTFGGKNLYVANDQGLAIIQNVTAPPRIDVSKISLSYDGSSSTAITGATNAVTGAAPLTLTLRNMRTAASATAPVASDGSFTSTLQSISGDAITATATDAAGRTAGPLAIGSVPFGAPARTTAIVISNDANFRARTIAAEGATVVVAGYPNPSGSDKVAVYDVSNPASPVLRRTLTLSAAQGPIRDVVVRNGWAFIAADHFATLNLGDPNAAFVNTPEGCGGRNAVAVAGGYAFVADSGCNQNGTIYVYDISDPSAPKLTNSQAVAAVSSHDFTDLQPLGNDYLVAISNSTSGRDVMIIDRRDVNALKKVGELQIANVIAFRGTVVGNVLYLAGGDGGAAIVDLSSPLAPRLLWSGDTPGIARGVDVVGTTMAIADGDDVAFYDASDPTATRFIGAQSTGGVAWDVVFTGPSLFIANDLGMATIEHVYTPPQITSSLIAIGTDGAISGSTFAVTPVASLTFNDGKSGASSSTTATTAGTFAGSIASSAGHPISVTATNGANQSSTRSIGAVAFVSVQRNDAATISGDTAFRARRVAADATNWIATNGTIGGVHINGGSSRALLFRQPDASSPPTITAFDTTAGTVEDVGMQNGFAYVTGDRFETINIAGTPAIQIPTSKPCGRELALAVAGNVAFGAETGCANNGTINIYDVSNPAAPLYVRQQAVGGASTINYRALIAYGTQYLIAVTPDKVNGVGRDVTVIDRGDLTNLRKVAELDVPNFDATSGAIDGTTLYLAGGDSGVAIVDISNPSAPAWLTTIDTPGIARAVAVSRTNEIAVADADVLTILDTSDRMRPVLLGSQPLQGNATDVKLSGGRLFVATETRSYVVIRP